MADIFATGVFGFMRQDIDIERQTLSGGMSLAGEQDVISTDGGGRVFADFSDGQLVDRSANMAWRATITLLDGGVTPMVVPFCNARFQPYGPDHVVTYGDGARHSDGSPFVGGGPFGEVTANASLRAVSLLFNGAFSQPIIGGEWFTITHPVKGERAYRIIKFDAVAGRIYFRPPLRQSVAAGTELDFANPRCLMVQDGTVSSPTLYKRQGQAAIRFVEAP